MHDGTHHEHTHEAMSEKEAIAMLGYMIDHNEHHESELIDIAKSLPEESKAKIEEALKYMATANKILKEALEPLEKKD